MNPWDWNSLMDPPLWIKYAPYRNQVKLLTTFVEAAESGWYTGLKWIPSRTKINRDRRLMYTPCGIRLAKPSKCFWWSISSLFEAVQIQGRQNNDVCIITGMSCDAVICKHIVRGVYRLILHFVISTLTAWRPGTSCSVAVLMCNFNWIMMYNVRCYYDV